MNGLAVDCARTFAASPSAKSQEQQMAKLMATEEVSPETKDLVDRMMLGRRPGSADERPGIIPKLSNGRRRSWTR